MSTSRDRCAALSRGGSVILCLLCCVASASVKLPEGFVLCSRNDPDIDKCFVAAANVNTLILKKGNEELEVASLDPLKIPGMRFVLGNEKAGLSISVELQDVAIYHTLDKFNKAHVDFQKNMIEIDVSLKDLDMIATHNTSGRFLVGRIYGHGKCKVLMKDLNARIRLVLSRHERNNRTYFHADQYHLKIRPKTMSSYFENIVGNNQNVNEALNKVINDNWQLVFPPLYPDIERATAPGFQDVLNGLLNSVPIEELFPENKPN